MDWMAQEQERGITITSAATTAFWKGNRVNIIDTPPGHVDFTVEVERSLPGSRWCCYCSLMLRVVLNHKRKPCGVKEQNISPRIVFVNKKMDAIGADFYMSVETLHSRLAANAAAVQLPIGAESQFHGLVDLIEKKAWYYEGDNSAGPVEGEIPAELTDKVEEYRALLLEAISQFDDEFMMKYLEGEEVTIQEIKTVIRKAVLTGQFFPVFAGSAYKNKGVQLLLDGVVDYLPSPLDVPPAKGELLDGSMIDVHSDVNEPLAALAFKIATDPFIGRLASCSGKITGFILTQQKAKNGFPVSLNANHREVNLAGDGAVVGKNTIQVILFVKKRTRLFLKEWSSLNQLLNKLSSPKLVAIKKK